MDKVYTLLKWLKQNHFWVLSVVAAIFAATTWYVCTSRLSQAYETAHNKIKGERDTVQRIANEQHHVNDKIHQAMDVEIEKRRESVKAAWETKWQQLENLLVWPDALTPEFHREISRLPRPEEISPKDPEKLHPGLCEEYRDYIKKELPKLAKIVGSKWTVGQNTSRGGGEFGMMGLSSGIPGMDMGIGSRPGSGMKEEDTQLVYWSNGDQMRIEQQRFDWSKQQRPTPTTLQVLYAQEDLWVLKALLEIIASANGDATTHNSATVKQIISLEWGREARYLLGNITEIVSSTQKKSLRGTADFAGGPGKMMPMGPVGPGGGIFGDGILGGGREGQQTLDPADERYVDDNFEPMAAADLRKVVDNENVSNVTLAVAKRMPVRMRVRVDQRKLHDLLIACGNSRLVVEVRQLRFDPDAVGKKSGDGGGRRMPGSFAGAGVGPAMMMGPGPSTFGASAGRDNQSTGETHDKLIELYGIIYIYNPVDEKLLEYDKSSKGRGNQN